MADHLQTSSMLAAWRHLLKQPAAEIRQVSGAERDVGSSPNGSVGAPLAAGLSCRDSSTTPAHERPRGVLNVRRSRHRCGQTERQLVRRQQWGLTTLRGRWRDNARTITATDVAHWNGQRDVLVRAEVQRNPHVLSVAANDPTRRERHRRRPHRRAKREGAPMHRRHCCRSVQRRSGGSPVQGRSGGGSVQGRSCGGPVQGRSVNGGTWQSWWCRRNHPERQLCWTLHRRRCRSRRVPNERCARFCQTTR